MIDSVSQFALLALRSCKEQINIYEKKIEQMNDNAREACLRNL